MKKRVKEVVIAFALSCLLLSVSMPALAEPDLSITAIKPYHYGWSEEYSVAKGDPWFNLTNYVEVTVVNSGNATAERFDVSLYVDDEPIGESETIDELPEDPEDNTMDVKFVWTPYPEPDEQGDPLSCVDTAEGAVCTYKDTTREYTLRAVVEWDGEKNESKKEQEVIWNGYMADELLENYVHDVVEGGILYTTGDGEYRSYESGESGTDDTSYDIHYDLDIPGSTTLARLYMYYTWAKPSYKAPKIGITLTTPAANSYTLTMEKSYNDIKGEFGGDIYAWGTYAYDLTEYVKGSGTYVVSVINQNYGGGDSDFATEYSFAPPAMLLVYEDTRAPKREYWINEGADLLMGGGEERPKGGFLSLAECKNTAAFPGDIDLSEVEEAVLGVVSVWGGNPVPGWHSYLYFNDHELGKDVYEGYSDSYSKELSGLSLRIGSNNAQIGIGLTDVADDLEDDGNEVIQGDDGDNMMPANAFLVLSYPGEEDSDEEEDGSERITSGSPGITVWSPAEAVVNNTEGESRFFNISVNQTVDIRWQINGTEVQKNGSVAEAVYTNTSAVIGTWNVSAIATNTTTGLSDMHTWIWTVTALTATPKPAVDISQTPTTPAVTSTVNETPGLTPALTPTSAPTEEKQKREDGADEKAPVPGFELPISLVSFIAAAYWIRKRERERH
jgi:hypothetical protein